MTQFDADVGSATARGFAWTMVQTLGTKCVSLGGQVVLAYLLDPDDWGIVGLALMLGAFASLPLPNGIPQVLMHRQRRFDRWAEPGFWMSAALGCIAALLLVAAAPIAAVAFEEPGLTGVVLVLACSYPISSLSIVSMATLQRDMRFDTIARIELTLAPLTIGLSIIFAALGFGPYSFILPVPIAAIARVILTWRGPPTGALAPAIAPLAFLAADSSVLVASAGLATLVGSADRAALGAAQSAAEVGLYVWAYRFSRQTVALFGGNVHNVLFAALARLQDDPDRQARGFLRATRLLALVCIPLCVLQASIARPVTLLVFPDKWAPAIPALEVLSLVMAFKLLEFPAVSMLHAQGRWLTSLRLMGIYATAFALAVAIAARSGVTAVAVAAGLVVAPMAIVSVRVAAGQAASVRGIAGIVLGPLAMAGVSFGLPLIAIMVLLPEGFARDITCVVTVTIAGAAIYVGLAHLLYADDCRELRDRLVALRPR